MEELIEIRWHGRGGQGAKTAAQFLAEAALEEGKYIQAFPEYGPERAGAPMRAYTRISSQPIKIHSAIRNPRAVVVIDPTLATSLVLEGLDKDGLLIINSSDSPDELRKRLNYKGGKLATVDANRISLEAVGRAMPNTPMLGALLKVFPVVSMEAIEKQVRAKFLKKIGEEKTEANIQAVRRAHNEVKIG